MWEEVLVEEAEAEAEAEEEDGVLQVAFSLLLQQMPPKNVFTTENQFRRPHNHPAKVPRRRVTLLWKFGTVWKCEL